MDETAKEELMKDRAAEVMYNLLFRDQAVKAEMDKPSTRNQVDAYLDRMLFWKRNGYEFTDDQSKKPIQLWQVVKGGEDGD